MLALFLDRQHLHGNVTGHGIELQIVQNRPSQHVWKEHVECDCRRPVLLCQCQGGLATIGDDSFESFMARQAEQHTRTYCIATAMVTQSMGFRFVLSSVFLLRPLVTPYTVCGTVAEALAFVQREARKREMPLPATITNPWPDAP